jgi:hypothetical protein
VVAFLLAAYTWLNTEWLIALLLPALVFLRLGPLIDDLEILRSYDGNSGDVTAIRENGTASSGDTSSSGSSGDEFRVPGTSSEFRGHNTN